MSSRRNPSPPTRGDAYDNARPHMSKANRAEPRSAMCSGAVCRRDAPRAAVVELGLIARSHPVGGRTSSIFIPIPPECLRDSYCEMTNCNRAGDWIASRNGWFTLLDTVVAVRVTRRTGSHVYFLTWGRIFDPVDTAGIERSIADFALASTDLKDDFQHTEVCRSLQEAAAAPYFFESFFEMAQAKTPETGWRLAVWKRRIARRMAKGQEIWFLGMPDAAPSA